MLYHSNYWLHRSLNGLHIWSLQTVIHGSETRRWRRAKAVLATAELFAFGEASEDSTLLLEEKGETKFERYRQ